MQVKQSEFFQKGTLSASSKKYGVDAVPRHLYTPEFVRKEFARVHAPSVMVWLFRSPGFRKDFYKAIQFQGFTKNRARYPKGLRSEAANCTNFANPNVESVL